MFSKQFDSISGGRAKHLSRAVSAHRLYSTQAFLDRLVNHEKTGVPSGAGTAGKDGFDLVRIVRALPHECR